VKAQAKALHEAKAKIDKEVAYHAYRLKPPSISVSS